MPGFRVGFEVQERLEDTGAHRVLGARVVLAAFGDGATPVGAGETKACSLRFAGRYVESARKKSDASFEPFAELNGLLGRKGTRPEFTFLPTSQLTLLKPNADERTTRTVALDFDGATFRLAPPASSELRSLALPDSPDPKKNFRHFELGAALVVDGAEVSAPDVNGVLDVPLAPLLTGLVLEWPAALDESVPLGLTLTARQGDLERVARWDHGQITEGRRRFVFRGVLGKTPVDLLASFSGREVTLWEQQDISNEDVPPRWKTTLEHELSTVFPASPGPPTATQTLPSNAIEARPSLDDFPEA